GMPAAPGALSIATGVDPTPPVFPHVDGSGGVGGDAGSGAIVLGVLSTGMGSGVFNSGTIDLSGANGQLGGVLLYNAPLTNTGLYLATSPALYTGSASTADFFYTGGSGGGGGGSGGEIVPAPGAAAMLAMAGVIGARRRRR
ncbi:MAG: hypothetical protein ACREJO_11405, partial [Phycisphaerales bacterium]